MKSVERRRDIYWRQRAASELRGHIRDIKAHRGSLVKLRDKIARNVEDADRAVAALSDALAGIDAL